jgi:hypothetical protein
MKKILKGLLAILYMLFSPNIMMAGNITQKIKLCENGDSDICEEVGDYYRGFIDFNESLNNYTNFDSKSYWSNLSNAKNFYEKSCGQINKENKINTFSCTKLGIIHKTPKRGISKGLYGVSNSKAFIYFIRGCVHGNKDSCNHLSQLQSEVKKAVAINIKKCDKYLSNVEKNKYAGCSDVIDYYRDSYLINKQLYLLYQEKKCLLYNPSVCSLVAKDFYEFHRTRYYLLENENFVIRKTKALFEKACNAYKKNPTGQVKQSCEELERINQFMKLKNIK